MSAEFWQAVTASGAKRCFFEGREYYGGCAYWGGCSDAHHILKQRWISDAFATRGWEEPARMLELTDECRRALRDWRNGIALCRFHHQAVESARIYIARAELPPDVLEFAAEFELEHLLDRHYPERRAA